jgi:probable rRNA maturation factor
MEIDVRNKSKANLITTYRLKKITSRVLKTLLNKNGMPDGEVSVVYVDDPEIEALNARYRRVRTPTDVLAFPMRTGKFASIHPALLGDIAISVEGAHRQAAQLGHPLERELAILLIHGFCHLLGHNHESEADARRMKALEATLLSHIEEEKLV